LARRRENRIKSKSFFNTINWYICIKLNNYGTKYINLIGEYYENFINGQIATGKYSSKRSCKNCIETF
jgi:hypothetical protein